MGVDPAQVGADQAAGDNRGVRVRQPVREQQLPAKEFGGLGRNIDAARWFRSLRSLAYDPRASSSIRNQRMDIHELRDRFPSIKDEVSPEEWQARVELAACYRLVDTYGMTDLIYNHITARIPGTDDHLLINLYGLLYKEITASSLVKIDVEGNIVWKPDTDYGINKSGYVIHGAIHKARPDVTMRHPHPYARRHGGLGDEMRAAAAVPDLDPLRRPYRLSRL